MRRRVGAPLVTHEAGLEIGAATYALSINSHAGWRPLAALAGGANALLPAERPLDERALEHAIQVAEDGLMLHATRLRGCTLTAQDHDGRLGQGLSYVLNMAAVRWRVDEIESMFGRVIELETRWVPPPTLEHRQGFVSDLRVLRELAHHGRLHEVRLHAAAQQSEVAP